MAQEGTYDYLLDQLINSPEMRYNRIRWQDKGFEVESAWINTRNTGMDLNTREVDAILDAVAKDAENENWGVYDWFSDRNDADQYDITVNVSYKLTDSKTDRSYDNISIVVREEMTETIRVLKELGLVTDRDLVTNRMLYPWRYTNDGWEEYDRFVDQFGISPEQYYDSRGEYPAGWFGTEGDDPSVDESYSPSMSAGAESA